MEAHYEQGSSRAERPLSPPAQMFLHSNCYTLIYCAVTTANPIHIPHLKSHLSASAFASHPRFTTVPVPDPTTGCHHWPSTPTPIDPDRHVIAVPGPVASVNDYLARLASASRPLPDDKPLWEIHVLPEPHRNCAVFVIHHALADGACVMALLESFCSSPVNAPRVCGKPERCRRRRRTVGEVAKMVWFTAVFMLRIYAKLLWDKDVKISGRHGRGGVELGRRKLAIGTASFSLEDMKIAKNAISPAATINDVLTGIVSSGLSRYLHLHSRKAPSKGLKLTGLVAMNLRQEKQNPAVTDLKGWGNKVGLVLNRFYYKDPKDSKYDVLYHLKTAKSMMDRKKVSLEAHLFRKSTDLGMTLCPEVITFFANKLLCNSTFTISNIVGPANEISMVGNPITSIRVNATCSSPKPQAIIMHMVSYAGKAELQILADQQAIPNPQILANLFEEALRQMKLAAITVLK
uniref:Diacylglycerol O-acyltransferase n=1 Tax=Kalanchoe fedtschenkoi TaxID=63787 RepID=A0A7N0RGH6_KALFE